MQSLENCLLVGIGGACGAMCRYIMTLLPLKHLTTLPLNTLLINIIGCAIIGAVFGLFHRHTNIDPHWELVMQTGFCGGFTTLSSMTIEFFSLQNAHQSFLAIAYITITFVLCLISTWVGMHCTAKI